jgi:hypothetical protein
VRRFGSMRPPVGVTAMRALCRARPGRTRKRLAGVRHARIQGGSRNPAQAVIAVRVRLPRTIPRGIHNSALTDNRRETTGVQVHPPSMGSDGMRTGVRTLSVRKTTGAHIPRRSRRNRPSKIRSIRPPSSSRGADATVIPKRKSLHCSVEQVSAINQEPLAEACLENVCKTRMRKERSLAKRAMPLE